MVWAVDEGLAGLQHTYGEPPHVAVWSDLATLEERLTADGVENDNRYRFWENFDQRPTVWISDWANRVAPHAGDGLVASHQQVWDDNGNLLASGISHLLCRPVR